MMVSIAKIRPNPFQVRKHYDRASIQALAEEIKALGFWAPLRARKTTEGYELCFGHRRLEALKVLKWKEVELDVVKLSDDDMATQALVENLQREGLTDLEKAAGIQQLVERFERNGDNQGRTKVAELMGLGKGRVNELLSLLEMTRPVKTLIERGQISGRTAVEARRLGGESMVQTAAKHKLPLHTVTKMSQELSRVPDERIRERVRKAVVAGKVRDPESVRIHARKVSRDTNEREGKRPPPDLRIVIRDWTRTMTAWAKQLDQVLPYLNYIDADPDTAAKFKTASRELIEKLKRFL